MNKLGTFSFLNLKIKFIKYRKIAPYRPRAVFFLLRVVKGCQGLLIETHAKLFFGSI